MNFTLSSRQAALALAPVAALIAATAFGHPGHGGAGHGGFVSGLLHPLLGPDHLLAMAAIGLWSVRQGGTLRRFVPLMMLAGMWGGAVLAWAGLALAGVEAGIALSVLLVGVLIATLARVPSLWGGVLVAAFMLFHGHVHGSELPAGASLMTYLAGFSLATLAIAYGGKRLGGWLQQREGGWVRALGAVIAAMGGFFAFS